MERTTVDAFTLSGLTADGERARDELTARLRRLDRVATRFTERRDARRHAEQVR
jgi:acyl-[acyl-carrier-protein] desaturase